MVAEFNKKAEEDGLYPDKAYALRGDLLADHVDENFSHRDYFDFDLVIATMAFHHFADVNTAALRLASRLKEGGVMFIIDGLPDSFPDHHHRSHNHEAMPTIQKHGFSEDEIRNVFIHGGVGKNFKFSVVDKPLVMTIDGKRLEKTVFVARGERSKL
jgi:SAM-dependent methyltransferase